MTPISIVRAVEPAPLEFTISLDPDRCYAVREKRGRGDGVFSELSSALLFIRESRPAGERAPVIKFDQSLAMIRAAG